MPTIQVELGLKQTIVLPQMVKIPVALMRQFDLPRWVSITQADQVVPKSLRDWMLTQRNYKSWFVEGEAVVVVAPSVEKDLDVSAADETALIEDGVEDNKDPALDKMTLPQLKTFAAENGIDLTGTSNKPAIRDAIDVALNAD